MTALKQKELEYSNSMQLTRERLDLALKSARMAVWDWDLTNNFLTWDESMYELYGVSENHLRCI